ncbi:MAG: DinB family protein [Planctomycetota bacterium]
MDVNDLVNNLKEMRKYTLMVLDGVREEDWFRFPDGCHTHIGWQVGHLAIAEYGLTLRSIRGAQDSDDFIPAEYSKLFGRGSVPAAASENPSIDEIRTAFEAVHEHVMQEVPGFSEELLAENVPFDHPLFKTKKQALSWCVNHEMTHAGQIAMIRRLLGYEIRF